MENNSEPLFLKVRCHHKMFVGDVAGYNRLQNANIYANKNTAALLNAMRSGVQAESTSYAAKSAKMDYFVSTRSVGQPEAYAAGEYAKSVEAVGGPEYHPIRRGETQIASWSGDFDPSRIIEGTTISINGVTFEFTSDSGGAGEEVEDIEENENIKVAIATGADGNMDPEANAKEFVDAVNNSANIDKIRKASGWVENFAPEIQTDYDETINENIVKAIKDAPPVSCSWKKETKEGEADKWILSVTQSEGWAHTGDKLDVKVDAGRLANLEKTVQHFSGYCYTGIQKIDLSQIRSGDVIKIGNNKFKVDLNSGLSGDYQVNLAGDNSTISIKDPSNIAAWREALSSAVDTTDTSVPRYTISARGSVSDFGIWVDFDNDVPDDVLNSFLDVHKPEVTVTQNVAAKIKTPAYLEYEVEYGQFADGDNFMFKGVRFVFDKDSNTATPEIKSGKEHTAYITANNSYSTVTGFRDTFNSIFARKRTGGIGKSTGTRTNGLQQAFSSIYSLLNAGAFEMKVALGENGKATVFIYAKTREVLENGEIDLDEDTEGWKTAEEVNAEAGEGAAGEGDVPPEGEAVALEAVALTEEGAVNATESNPVAENGEPVLAEPAAEERAVNFSAEPVKEAPASSEASDKLEDETKAVQEGAAAADASGISSEKDAEKLVQDAKEKILENPEESVEAQASNLQGEAVVQLTTDS